MMLTSCDGALNYIKDFNAYKKPLSTPGFKTDGIYLADGNSSDEAFFFYQNGMVKTLSIEKKQFLADFDFNVDRLSNKSDGYTEEYWGHYFTKGDSLTIQRFNRLFSNIYKRKMIEYQAILIDSETIKIVRAFSVDDKKQFIDKPIMLSYYKTKTKPDSSKAWFLEEKWYRDSINPSRKIN